jgi:hypothetical protein
VAGCVETEPGFVAEFGWVNKEKQPGRIFIPSRLFFG